MMKKLLFAILVFPALASAANWIDAGMGHKFGFYLDVHSIAVTKNGDRKAWTKYEYPNARPLSNGTTYEMVMALELYRCSERTTAELQQVFYEKADAARNVHTIAIRPEEANFDDVVPGSLDERILNFVCAHDVKISSNKKK